MSAPLRCLTYARVSTDMQAEKDDGSLVTQLVILENHMQREGWVHIGHIEDPAISGGILDRKGLNQARDWAKAGRYDILLYYKQERFVRDTFDFLLLCREFASRGVRVVSATECVDLRTAEGELVGTQLAAVSQYNRRLIRQRIKDAVKRRGLEGQVIGKVQYGYQKDPHTKKRIPDPATHLAPQRCATLYLELQSTPKVAAQLQTEFPNRKWTAADISRILKDKTYLGVARFNERNDNKEIIATHELPDAHPPLIDFEDWKACQALLARNRKNHRSPNRDTKHGIAIAGLITCACRDKMKVRVGNNGQKRGKKNYAYLECPRLRGKSPQGPCTLSTRVDGKKLEAALVDIVRQAAQEPRIIKLALEALNKIVKARFEEDTKRLKTLKAAVKKLQRRIRKLTQAEHIEEVLDAIQERKKELEASKAEIERIEALEAPPRASKKQLAKITHALTRFTTLYEQLLPRERQQLFELTFSAITWHGSMAILTCRGDNTQRIIPYSNVSQKFGTDHFWEQLPTELALRGEGPRRPQRKGTCTTPHCSGAIHAQHLCWTHYVESMGGYRGHGKRGKILEPPESPDERAVEPAEPEKKTWKLTEEDINEIIELREQGLSYRKIGKRLCVSHVRIIQIIKKAKSR